MKWGYLLIIASLFLVGCINAPKTTATVGQQLENSNVLTVSEQAIESPIDINASTFGFEGFAPGKSHVGYFSEYDGSLYYEDDVLVGATGVIQVNSLDTGIGALDSHLKAEDFFYTEMYPTIAFESTEIVLNDSNSYLAGALTVKGISAEVQFPINQTDTGMTADFVLDTTPFGIEHPAASESVRIFFDMRK